MLISRDGFLTAENNNIGKKARHQMLVGIDPGSDQNILFEYHGSSEFPFFSICRVWFTLLTMHLTSLNGVHCHHKPANGADWVLILAAPEEEIYDRKDYKLGFLSPLRG